LSPRHDFSVIFFGLMGSPATACCRDVSAERGSGCTSCGLVASARAQLEDKIEPGLLDGRLLEAVEGRAAGHPIRQIRPGELIKTVKNWPQNHGAPTGTPLALFNEPVTMKIDTYTQVVRDITSPRPTPPG
jgi:hypothetical protein